MSVATTGRKKRVLSRAEQKVQEWIKDHHGVLSNVAKDTGLSIAFVQRVAYNRGEARSKGLKVENRLASLGCPLIQPIR